MKSDRILNAIGEIDDDLIAKAKAPRAAQKRSHGLFKRMIALAAMLVIILTGTVVALAASDNEAVYRILYGIVPSLAQTLKPVNLSDEDNGIRLDVLAASIDGDTANVYIALTDLTGDRVDGSIDLFDSYFINVPGNFSSGSIKVDYDATKKSATFLLLIRRTDGGKIDGEKVTFSFTKFLSHKKEFTLELTEHLASADMNPALRGDINVRGWGGDGEYTTVAQVRAFGNMVADPEKSVPITEGVSLEKIGFVDGKLRVQTLYKDILNTDNHGSLYLTDEDDNQIIPHLGISSWDDNRKDSRDESIFDVSPSDISKYRLFGDFVTSDTLTEGDWKVTFPLKAVE